MWSLILLKTINSVLVNIEVILNTQYVFRMCCHFEKYKIKVHSSRSISRRTPLPIRLCIFTDRNTSQLLKIKIIKIVDILINKRVVSMTIN